MGPVAETSRTPEFLRHRAVRGEARTTSQVIVALANAAIIALAVAAIHRRDYALAASSAVWFAANVAPVPAPYALAIHALPCASGAALTWHRLARGRPWPALAYLTTAVAVALVDPRGAAHATIGALGSVPWIGVSILALVLFALGGRAAGRRERAAIVIALGDASGLLGALTLGAAAESWMSVEIQALITALMALSTQTGECNMKCEKCGAVAKGYSLHDYCAVCSKNLCDDCMAKGHCGSVPAKSGNADDDVPDEESAISRIRERKQNE